MPHYFFHLLDDVSRREDLEGLKLPDPEAAWYQGVRSARDVIEIDLKGGGVRPGGLVEVVDEEGDQIWAVPFEDVISLAV
jgi:hypothetical protein